MKMIIKIQQTNLEVEMEIQIPVGWNITPWASYSLQTLSNFYLSEDDVI